MSVCFGKHTARFIGFQALDRPLLKQNIQIQMLQKRKMPLENREGNKDGFADMRYDPEYLATGLRDLKERHQ